jgi:hypothetical protein
MFESPTTRPKGALLSVVFGAVCPKSIVNEVTEATVDELATLKLNK